jgi:hypothetical protein
MGKTIRKRVSGSRLFFFNLIFRFFRNFKLSSLLQSFFKQLYLLNQYMNLLCCRSASYHADKNRDWRKTEDRASHHRARNAQRSAAKNELEYDRPHVDRDKHANHYGYDIKEIRKAGIYGECKNNRYNFSTILFSFFLRQHDIE